MLKLLERLLWLGQIKIIQHAQVEIGRCVIRLDRDRVLIGCFRLGKLAEFSLHDAELIVCNGIVRITRKRRVERRLGLRVARSAQVQQSEVHLGSCEIGIGQGKLLEFELCIVRAARLHHIQRLAVLLRRTLRDRCSRFGRGGRRLRRVGRGGADRRLGAGRGTLGGRAGGCRVAPRRPRGRAAAARCGSLARSAIAAMLTNRIDLLLTDFHLRVTAGIELCQRCEALLHPLIVSALLRTRSVHLMQLDRLLLERKGLLLSSTSYCSNSSLLRPFGRSELMRSLPSCR